MVDITEYFEDCVNCKESNGLYVRALIDFDSGEIVEFQYQECNHCGWNQSS